MNISIKLFIILINMNNVNKIMIFVCIVLTIIIIHIIKKPTQENLRGGGGNSESHAANPERGAGFNGPSHNSNKITYAGRGGFRGIGVGYSNVDDSAAVSFNYQDLLQGDTLYGACNSKTDLCNNFNGFYQYKDNDGNYSCRNASGIFGCGNTTGVTCNGLY